MIRRHQSVSLLQATEESPSLSRLSGLVRDSNARLDAVRTLIPAGLRMAVKAGPIEGDSWCLLLDNNSTAAKLRQLLPSLEAHLRTAGWPAVSIRLKVQSVSRM